MTYLFIYWDGATLVSPTFIVHVYLARRRWRTDFLHCYSPGERVMKFRSSFDERRVKYFQDKVVSDGGETAGDGVQRH